MRLKDRVAVIHRTSQIRVRESDSSKGRVPQHLSRRRLAIVPKEKSRLRIEIRMTPPIQNNSRDVALCIKTCRRKHFRELLPDSPLILAERCGEHLAAPEMSLLFRRE